MSHFVASRSPGGGAGSRAGRKVAVVGGTPTWRRGMAATLADAGHQAVDLADLADWKPGRDGVAVMTWGATPEALAALEEFAGDFPHIPVVAVLAETGLADFAAAIRAGAIAVVGEDEPIEVFAAVLEAAVSGRSSVAGDIVRSLAARIPDSPDPHAWLDDEEIRWLQALTEGTTVAALAESVGYSEREMFRMLGDLYARIGVANRTESIVWAARHGLV